MRQTNSKSIQILSIIAILEAGIITVLVIHGTHFVVQKVMSPVAVVDSPIALAAEYESPDKKFEEVVKKHRKWLQYRALGEKSFTVLAECAYHRQTNYVRILIENGADVEMALKELNLVDAKDGAALLQKIQSGVKAAKSDQ